MLNAGKLAGCIAAVALSATVALAAPAEPLTPKQVVDNFDDLILAHKPRQAIETYIAPDFVEHDPEVAVDGRDGLLKYMHDHGWETNGNAEMRDIIDREIVSGPMVVVHHHLYRNATDRGVVYVDIFRVENGLIQEHWDVMQPIPEHTDNKHTMY